jgi:hypothetical protein
VRGVRCHCERVRELAATRSKTSINVGCIVVVVAAAAMMVYSPVMGVAVLLLDLLK